LPPKVFGFDFRKEVMESQSGFVQQIQKCIFIAIFLELVITESILAIYRYLAPRSCNQEAKNAIMARNRD
jgi:hypothetical protein